MPASIEQFARRLIDSGLMSAAELEMLTREFSEMPHIVLEACRGSSKGYAVLAKMTRPTYVSLCYSTVTDNAASACYLPRYIGGAGGSSLSPQSR